MTTPSSKREKVGQLRELLKKRLMGTLGMKMDRLTDGLSALVATIKSKPEKIDVIIPDSITLSNFTPAPDEVSIKNLPEVQKSEIVNFPEAKDVQKVEIINPTEAPEVQKVHVVNEQPSHMDVNVLNMPAIEPQEKTSAWMPDIVKVASAGIVEALSKVWIKLWEVGITVRLDASEREMPLKVIVVDEHGKPVRNQGGGGANMMFHSSANPIPSQLRDGNATIPTAGTSVPLFPSAQAAYDLIITAHESNTGTVVIGGPTVKAALSGRSGTPLFPTQSYSLKIADLSKVHVDSTASGDKVTFTYSIL